jgi:hypothetical protein
MTQRKKRPNPPTPFPIREGGENLVPLLQGREVFKPVKNQEAYKCGSFHKFNFLQMI